MKEFKILRRFLSFCAVAFLSLPLVSCPAPGGGGDTATYAVKYSGNGNTEGGVPVDGKTYKPGDTVTVLENYGNLAKAGKVFDGWNTAPDGSGESFLGGWTFTMKGADVTLHAQWTLPTYSVTYDRNRSTGGTVPADKTGYCQGQSATVLGNTGSLVKAGNSFAGWNTKADGSGASYTSGQTLTIGSANLTLYAKWTLVPGFVEFVSLADAINQEVWFYSVNTATGALTKISDYYSGNGFNCVAADPSSNNVYATDGWGTYSFGFVSAQIVGFAGGGASGARGSPYYVAVDHAGKFAFVLNYKTEGCTVCAYNASYPAVSAGSYPSSIAAHPSANYIYVTNQDDNSVSAFSYDQYGKLSQLSGSPYAAGSSPGGAAADPTGRFLYVANSGGASLSAYSIDSTTGALTALSGSPFSSGTNPYSIAPDPTGRFLYVANKGSATIGSYTIDDATGALSSFGTTPIPSGTTFYSLATDPMGKYLHLASYLTGTNNVKAFAINPDSGALTQVSGAICDYYPGAPQFVCSSYLH